MESIDRKQRWIANNLERYREYQRVYQQARYESGSRRDEKKDYYAENKQHILGRKMYVKVASVFRNILVEV